MTPENDEKINAAWIKQQETTASQQKADYITKLRAKLADINAELQELGAKRVRKARTTPVKRGRPVGSRKVAPVTNGSAAEVAQ